MTGGGRAEEMRTSPPPVADFALMKTVHSTCPVAVLSMRGGGHPSGGFPASICVFDTNAGADALVPGGFYVTIRGLIFLSFTPEGF
jgi:hypothetical protein